MSSEYEELEVITKLLCEIRDNYYEILSQLDELEDDTLETVFDEDYKKIIDTIRGIEKNK